MLSNESLVAAPLSTDPLRLHADYRPPADRHDEMCDRGGELRAALELSRPRPRGARQRRVRRPLRGDAAAAARERRHLQRLRRPAAHRSTVAARPAAAARHQPRVEPDRARRLAARRSARGAACRSVRAAHGGAPRPGAGGAGAVAPGLPAPLRRGAPAAASPASVRRRPGAHGGRRGGGHRGPRAGAVGLRLRAREPHHPVARVSQHLPGFGGAPAGALLPRLARDARQSRPARAGQPAHRLADTRAGERDVLRARLSRRLSRLPAGPGVGSAGARRPRLAEGARRPQAGGRHPAARRTTPTATRSSCAPTRCSARRACCRRLGSATSPSPTRWAPACSRIRR